jgi:DNA replication ATP-dependent helicase Dna2
LKLQYRMAKEIMSISNRVIYNNDMRCGSKVVAEGTLVYPASFPRIDPWIREVLDAHRKVVIVDTDSIGDAARQTTGKDGSYNIFEARLIVHLLLAMKHAGLSASSIGVTSPYKAQLRTIRSELLEDSLRTISQSTARTGATAWESNLEIETIDKYQGRDKDCMLVSFVRSNEQRAIGELLWDWQRLNVAFTRARFKMILICSCNTLKTSPPFETLLSEAAKSGWIVRASPFDYKPLSARH